MFVLVQIFWVFFRISFLSFGGVFGVLPELERMIVLDHQWMTHERFIQSYVVSQFVPGPTMAMCPLVGYWVAGWPGWIAGFLGIYLPPILIMGAVFLLLRKYHDILWVKRLELGLRPLVLGLLSASTFRLWWYQSLGITSTSPMLARSASLGLAVGGLWIYRRGWLSAINLIFVFGAGWWALNRFVF